MEQLSLFVFEKESMQSGTRHAFNQQRRGSAEACVAAALVNRELYLPVKWSVPMTSVPDGGCDGSGGVCHRATSGLARLVIERAWDVGVDTLME